MNEPRRHPDLFTASEATAYLSVSEAQLETLTKDFGLIGHPVGRTKVFWREDLERTAYLMVGRTPPPELQRGKELRMAR